MPGLVGLISDDVRDKQLLDRMTNSIKHEEWYKVDRYIGPPFNIARVHLGIFNPEPQPIFNEDGTLCIFMEGKVYGYDDEKKRLQEKHHFNWGQNRSRD
jgi:asparagine synthase (glutamine-hydrolysing)